VLSLHNKTMIVWALILFTLKFVYSLASIFLVTLERLEDNVAVNQPKLFFLYYLGLRTYNIVVDFLFAVTLIYLFDCQAKIKRVSDENVKGQETMADTVLKIEKDDIEYKSIIAAEAKQQKSK